VELSIVDVLAFAIYITQARAAESFPFKVVGIFYLLAVLASVFEAEFAQPALFYAWQTVRILFIALVISRAVAVDMDIVLALLRGMAYGIMVSLGSAAWDRFVNGTLQVRGTFAHQNTFGLISHFITFPFLAMLLAGAPGWLPIIVPLAGAVIAILTASRATIVLTGAGCVFLFLCSALRGWSPRTTKVAIAGAAVALVLIPIAISTLEARLGTLSVFTEDEEREAFKRAAAMMVEDHPMGVGANYYVFVANAGGYSDRAGVIPTAASRAANVHNVYWLVWAETGYVGIIAFILFLVRPVFMAFRNAFYSHDFRGEILLGLGVALLVVYLHSFLEWTFLTFQVQYPFGVTIGLIAGLSQQVRREADRRIEGHVRSAHSVMQRSARHE
jgi:hypothetical protein